MVSFPCNTPCIAAETHRIRMQNFLANRSCPIMRYCQIKACVSNKCDSHRCNAGQITGWAADGRRQKPQGECLPIENTDWLLVSFTMLTGFAAVLSFCHFVNGDNNEQEGHCKIWASHDWGGNYCWQYSGCRPHGAWSCPDPGTELCFCWVVIAHRNQLSTASSNHWWTVRRKKAADTSAVSRPIWLPKILCEH